MSNSHSQSTFDPEIPKDLCSEKFLELCDALSITYEPYGNNFYLYSDDGGGSGYLDVDGVETEVTEDDLFAEFQEIIKNSNGTIPYVTMETAYTHDKMRPGEFGGAAVFITADDVQYMSTSSWLSQRKAEIETGGTSCSPAEP